MPIIWNGAIISITIHITANTKSVIQRSKAGNEIARYKSIREAERKTGIKNITITRCCKGVYKTAGGYVWEYDLTAKEV